MQQSKQKLYLGPRLLPGSQTFTWVPDVYLGPRCLPYSQVVLKRIVIFAIRIVAIPNNLCTHTHADACINPCMHTRMHTHVCTCMYAHARMHTHVCTRTHAHTHAHTQSHTLSSCGRWHAQLAANLFFTNNLEVFPYRTPQRPTCRLNWACL